MKNTSLLFAWALLLPAFLLAFSKTEAGATSPEAAGIETIQWWLYELSGNPVSSSAGEKRPFLTFDAATKQATGFAGCNNFFSSFERDSASLKFGPVGSTRMSCPDLQMSLETEFFVALDKTRAWNIKDDVLHLLYDSDVLARFTKEPFHGVTGPTWHWMQTLYNDDRKVGPVDPQIFTVQFREDGTLTVKADCNQKGGTYSVTDDENHISIVVTHSTMAVCPEGSLEDEFVRDLSAASIYFLKDGDLYIDLQFDSGTMRFSKEEAQ